MIEITYNKTVYKTPSEWDELTKDQFEKVSWVYSKTMIERSQIGLDADRIILFKTLTQMPIRRVNKISSSQWFDLLPITDFIFANPTLSKNPLPEILVGRNKYIGPTGLLDYSSFEEMINADTAFSNASKKLDSQYLYALLSILWRPERADLESAINDPDKWNGDRRESFNITLCKSRIDLLKKHIPIHIAVACYLYYWSFRELKLLKFKSIFDKASSAAERSGTDYGWAAIRLELSGKKFGSYKETGNEHWFTIMVDIQRELEKAKDVINNKKS